MAVNGYATVMAGTDGSESSFRADAVARDSGAALLLACAFRPMSAREVQDALGGGCCQDPSR